MKPLAASLAPPAAAFTAAERRIVGRVRTPAAVQAFLNRLPYNSEPPPGGATLRSFRGVVRHGTAHCLEAALAAAVILEQHGYPPLVLSFESIDELDHVLFVYQQRAGGIGRPVTRSRAARQETDLPHRARGRSVMSSRCRLSRPDHRPRSSICGRCSVPTTAAVGGNAWKAERVLLDAPHRAINSSDTRIDRLRRKLREFRKTHDDRAVNTATAHGQRCLRQLVVLNLM